MRVSGKGWVERIFALRRIAGGAAIVLGGAFERLIAVEHPPGQGAVLPAVAGPMVIEQRGQAIAGYGPA